MPTYTPSQALWLRATSESLRWPAGSKADAYRLRFQLYNLRRAWRRAADPFASIADLVEVVVRQIDGQWWTYLQPKCFDVQALVDSAQTTTGPAEALSLEDQRLLALADAAQSKIDQQLAGASAIEPNDANATPD